jgi:[protein-PII] uridylyltransferase
MTTQEAIRVLRQELADTRAIIPVFKKAIADFRANLVQRFNAGEDAGVLIRDHSDFLDQTLTLAWQRFDWNENLKSWRKTRISLVAVGGYGRGEMHPSSDIDLLILLERSSYQIHQSNIQSFLTLLWDIGLEVGHSVRSIKECKRQASQDVTVVTAMMEARTICGADDMRLKMLKQTSSNKMWPAKRFYQAKREEQNERHQKSDHTEYSLEPNVKTSPGGLRDIQTLMWIAKRNFGSVDFDDLVKLNFLTLPEKLVLERGQQLLWKIRFGLHAISGRADDRLLFEYQTRLAELFGYTDAKQLAVEQFMQDYYRSAMQTRAVTELLLQHFDEAILRSSERTRVRTVNDRFQITNDYIEVTGVDVFINHPPAMLELFVIVANDASIQGIRSSTVRLIQESIHLIDDDFRHNSEVNELFLQLLRSKDHLFSQLRRMERLGLLDAYLPAFTNTIGQMQFDLFHIYTVDAHTLQVIRNMRRFRYKNQEQKFPIAAHIHPRLPKIELLYISGLYHDIAKGMGGDHSQLGVDIAVDFCKRHSLSTWDTNLVAWLVKNHLVMSGTAQRKDISDPEVIREFALFVADQVRLDYLYALTVADINATNPTLWNSWRASLMHQLYLETKRQLREGLENYVDRSHYISENQNHAIARLIEHGLEKQQIIDTWGNVDDDYFVRESIADIVWHTVGIHAHGNQTEPLILIRNDVSSRWDEGATHVFIHTTKRSTLFVATISAFDSLGLNIVDARIAESDTGHAFYTFIVLDADDEPVAEKGGRMDKIRSTLIKCISTDHVAISGSRRRTPRMLKQFDFKTEIVLSHDESAHQTILQVTTPDRPGLLSIVADIFLELGIQVQSAKITTLGERVEDVFYIVDENNQPLGDESICLELEQQIAEKLDQHVKEDAA